MHKIFAKPSFLGKHVIYLPECHSTNTEMASMSRSGALAEGTVLYTGYQTSGKGQRGNTWEAAPNENLLCSIYLKPRHLALAHHFYLNLVIGLAVLDVLDEKVEKENNHLKWPNDIYIEEAKIGGILIESSVKQGTIEGVIVGLGLNVNQIEFSLPSATSLKIQTQAHHPIADLLERILCAIEKRYELLGDGQLETIKRDYYARLMWRNERHHFKIAQGRIIEGIIQGIDDHGRLRVAVEEGTIRTFDVKEIEFLK